MTNPVAFEEVAVRNLCTQFQYFRNFTMTSLSHPVSLCLCWCSTPLFAIHSNCYRLGFTSVGTLLATGLRCFIPWLTTMEVVLLGSAVSNIAILLIERYAKWPPNPTIVPQAQTRSAEAHESRGDQPPESENANSRDQHTLETEEPPEGSIPALEKKLKELRAEAKRVNSPDTFVQYARLSREANKVEKELMEKKGKAQAQARSKCACASQISFHRPWSLLTYVYCNTLRLYCILACLLRCLSLQPSNPAAQTQPGSPT